MDIPAPSVPVPLARVALWMSGTICAFSLMAIAGREAGLVLDTFEIMLFRSLTGIVIVLGIGGMAGTLGQVRTRRLPLHVLRNAAHFAGQNLWFYALPLIPLAQVFALEFTAPLWVVLLAPVLIGERLTRRRLAATALGFVGILVVARPDFAALNPGVVAVAVAAICFALVAVMTRRLTETESITAIMFWLTLTQAVMGLVFASLDGEVTFPQGVTVLWVGLIGAMGLGAHFCLTRALALAPASTVMPIDFIRLPVIAVLGMLLYDEALDPAVFAGAALIVGANWINLAPPRRRAAARGSIRM